jgi:hypothetical protein
VYHTMLCMDTICQTLYSSYMCPSGCLYKHATVPSLRYLPRHNFCQPAPSPLHAEALALTFAAKIAAALQLSQPTFLTDNLSLARAAATNSLTDPRILWQIRNLVAEFKQVSQCLQASICHIKRDLNGIAHNCSQQASRNLLF